MHKYRKGGKYPTRWMDHLLDTHCAPGERTEKEQKAADHLAEMRKKFMAMQIRLREAEQKFAATCSHPVGEGEIQEHSQEDTYGRYANSEYRIVCTLCGTLLAHGCGTSHIKRVAPERKD